MHTNTETRSPSFRFQAERWIVAHHGTSAIVRLTAHLTDPAALNCREVLIDGCLYRCSRVETAARTPPFRAGEYITLLVETPDE